MSAFIDLAGKQFGRWTILDVMEKGYGTRDDRYWRCICECGNIKILPSALLRNGKSKSCGCYKRDRPKRILPIGVSERNYVLRIYKKNAEKRNLEFLLSVEQFTDIINQNCFYCGTKPQQKINLKGLNNQYVYNGIDRIDNSIGYTIENCVPCCETCNRAKRIMTSDEFAGWIIRTYHHFASAYFSDVTVLQHHKLNKEMEELGIPR